METFRQIAFPLALLIGALYTAGREVRHHRSLGAQAGRDAHWRLTRRLACSLMITVLAALVSRGSTLQAGASHEQALATFYYWAMVLAAALGTVGLALLDAWFSLGSVAREVVEAESADLERLRQALENQPKSPDQPR